MDGVALKDLKDLEVQQDLTGGQDPKALLELVTQVPRVLKVYLVLKVLKVLKV